MFGAPGSCWPRPIAWARGDHAEGGGQQDRSLALASAVMDEGVEGLLRDKTRPPGTPRLPLDVAERVVALTLCDPPGETTHWTGRLMAKVAGVGLTSVQRIWKLRHGLAPHRIRAFKLSNDPVIGRRAPRFTRSRQITSPQAPNFVPAVHGFRRACR